MRTRKRSWPTAAACEVFAFVSLTLWFAGGCSTMPEVTRPPDDLTMRHAAPEAIQQPDVSMTDRTAPETPPDTFMTWCTVGDSYNLGEPSGEGVGGFGKTRICGAVNYVYEIGKYEVTNEQYCAFLNAVATDADPHRLYSPQMGSHRFGGIRRIVTGSVAQYVVDKVTARKPVNFVSFFDACRFANWMHNGRGSGSTETGAYELNDVINPANRVIQRQSRARVAVTSEDEWYKAAYFKPGTRGEYWDHATRSDAPPKPELPPGGVNSANCMTVERMTDVGAYVHAPGPFGTFDQVGSVWEWNEAILGSQGEYRAARGGCFGSLDLAADRTHNPTYWEPTHETEYTGFRVVRLPSP